MLPKTAITELTYASKYRKFATSGSPRGPELANGPAPQEYAAGSLPA